MARLLILSALIAASTVVAAVQADYERPTPAQILADLKKASPNQRHPRLLVTSDRFAEIKSLRATDAKLNDWCVGLQTEADKILTQGPVTYSTTGFSGVLSQSRTVLHDAQVLGLIYRLTYNRQYAERLWTEVATVCERKKFKDWGPSRYGDTVEMATGVAIAYDWLFDFWSADQKKLMRENIREEMLTFVAKRMAGKEQPGGKKITNIRLVYTGGAATAALAIADEADTQDLACEVIALALQYAEPGMALFAPDGAWYEGARYWGYALQYHEYLIASVASATGSTYGLLTAPGFASTGSFPVYLAGPCGNFDFHDDDIASKLGDQLSWLGHQFNDDYGRLRVAEIDRLTALREANQKYLAEEATKATAEGRKAAKLLAKLESNSVATVFDVLFYKPAFKAGAVALSKDIYFRDVETATFRSAWNDSNAAFLGVHFGKNEGAHAHLDMGTFVFDAQSVRWAADYGGGSYDWPGYLESDPGKGHPYRFDYYLARAEGHNTIVIDPDSTRLDQNMGAATRIAPLQSTVSGGIAIADMTSAYTPRAVSAKRGFMFQRESGQVIVQDEITLTSPFDVNWGMHTAAHITISADQRSAILDQEGKRLWVGIISPQPAAFSVVQPPHMQRTSQSDYDRLHKLAIELKQTGEVMLTVMLRPLASGEDAPKRIPAVQPLALWKMKDD